jgi:hypothetical protein
MLTLSTRIAKIFVWFVPYAWQRSNLSLPLGGTHELGPWRRRIDTALVSPHDIVEWEDASSVSA